MHPNTKLHPRLHGEEKHEGLCVGAEVNFLQVRHWKTDVNWHATMMHNSSVIN
jgi:hypothetical protein